MTQYLVYIQSTPESCFNFRILKFILGSFLTVMIVQAHQKQMPITENKRTLKKFHNRPVNLSLILLQPPKMTIKSYCRYIAQPEFHRYQSEIFGINKSSSALRSNCQKQFLLLVLRNAVFETPKSRWERLSNGWKKKTLIRRHTLHQMLQFVELFD